MATSSSPPQVRLTQAFRDALAAEGANADDLAEQFAQWKHEWPRWEDKDFYFGKDGDYYHPRRRGESVLRHVHMPPEDPNTWPATRPALTPEQHQKIEAEVRRWDTVWDQSRAARYRTSSRVLVYVDGGRHGYLLMTLAREPEGHDEITDNKPLMDEWADVAERFRDTGDITL